MSESSAQPWAEAAAVERDTVRDVMGSKAGRRLLLDLITPALLSASFVPGDPLATAFNEGRRSIVLELLARLDRIAPELLLAGRREELDEVQRKLAAREKAEHEQEKNDHG